VYGRFNSVRLGTEEAVPFFTQTLKSAPASDAQARFAGILAGDGKFVLMMLCLRLATRVPFLFLAGAALLAAQATAPASQTVVATVDGKEVTADQVRRMIASAPPSFFTALKANPAVAIRDFFIVRELSTEAEKYNLADESPWKEQIENTRTNILANAMIVRVLNVYSVPEEQTEKYYQDNLARFEKAEIKIIKIAFQPGAQPATAISDSGLEAAARAAVESAHGPNRSESDARKLAESLVAQLRGGADFKKLAGEYSDDAESKQSGGDFGSITGTSPYPEDLKKAALALKPGEISDPVRVSVAFYIVRCDSKSVQSLKDVHDTIVSELKVRHRDEFLNQLQKRFTPAGVNSAALSDIANGK